MKPRVVVLRPEPGNAETADRAAARGFDVMRLPLFAVRPLAWTPPEPDGFDALLMTSAAAVRHAGAGLAALTRLPVVAVGEATAAAARAAGLMLAATGDEGVATALGAARAHGLTRLLHLAGRERMPDQPGVRAIPVYASDPLPVAPGTTRTLAEGRTALLHSPRAARRLSELVGRDATLRAAIAIAALSPAVLAAAGEGWRSGLAAGHPTDAALLDLLESPLRSTPRD
ncbi:uroporphyrinogen-III synthase [uncultured Sphingomonas sp.]|uniref:uroporphyrinogen-III synthase n=1 Tax=uncultured Sphingomonas sp. TaxID=158754 RepID=UPI0035C9AF8C